MKRNKILMRYYFLSISVLLLSILFSSNPASSAEDSEKLLAAETEETGSITGKVTNESGSPLSDINVTVKYSHAQWGYVDATTTDSAGNYSVSGLTEGAYKLFFSSSGASGGYISEWYSDKTDFDTADPITVTANGTTSNIDAVLAAGGSISGRITDELGNGIDNVVVDIYDDTDSCVFEVSTDADGNYTKTCLPSGSYKIKFHAWDTYIDEWYNDKTSSDDADAVTVTAPDPTINIDAVLLHGGAISGRVTDEAGNPISWLNVYVIDNGERKIGTADYNGYYTIAGLPSGSYNVHFDEFYGASNSGYVDEWYDNKGITGMGSKDNVEVVAPYTTGGIDAALATAGTLSGNVTDKAGLPLKGIDVSVPIWEGHYGTSFSGSTDSDGNYIITGLPVGSHTVEFDTSWINYLNRTHYASEWYDNRKARGDADPVEITAGGTTSDINAVIENGGNISGRVTDKAGNGIAGVSIYLRDSFSNAQVDYYGYATDTTDSNGDYTVEDLPVGSYKVEFSTLGMSSNSNYLGEWYNNKRNFFDAEAVSVTALNTTSDINAVLEEGGGISGKVTDETGSGITGVTVYVYDDSHTYLNSGNTNSNGDYTVTGLPGGASYKVQFNASWGASNSNGDNYVSEWYNDKQSFDDADTVSVTALNTTSEVNAALSPGGGISGRVTDTAGTPVSDLWISAYNSNKSGPPSQRDSWNRTDVDGKYTLRGLSAGSYKILFGADNVKYAAQWYNNKSSYDSAVAVSVTVPDITSGIDAVLESPKPKTISAIIQLLLLK